MSDYDDVLETTPDGKYRAVIVMDIYPEAPDGDYFGRVFYKDDRSGMFELQAKPYGATEEDFGLTGAWQHFRDMALIERYVRMFEGVVGFDYFDTREGAFVNIVTMDDLATWGFASVEQYREQTGNDDPSHDNLKEWRAYSEGDAWYFRIERKVRWTTEDGDFDDHDSWETVESIGGFYDRKHAEETAREELAATTGS